ncbi:MAG: ATP-dependent zinc metalloprotease FtsH [Treponema sp.]|nr:ATP-dependent zinc metalloprotease FtsH [Treponema sp.]MDD7768520.1 ATP-dependent zinc metalloprotease FtsH [Treponema sp.]MDY3131276.1 ATP-dependent zinc metalloprotease FtsH [Treponema sp.]
MANNSKKSNSPDDENDPFNFFKFPGPDSNNKGDNNKNKKPENGHKIPFFVILIAVIGFLFLIQSLASSVRNEGFIEYSKFRSLVENGTIVNVEINDSYLIGYEKPTTVTNQTEKKGIQLFSVDSEQIQRGKAYKAKANIIVLPELTALMDEKGISYTFIIKENNGLLSFLLTFGFPIGCILLLYYFLFRKMGGGSGGGMGSIFNVGASRAKVVEEGKTKTRFSDVAGVDEAKEELVEVVDFLKSPKKYTDIGGKIPKGVLLVGPPGTGKTLLARAVAGEAGVPFFRISGSDFVEMFVGVGASRVRDLFKQAREKAPCIIFIDELDAIGKSRVNNLSGNDEREQTLNQLLVEMDGFDNEKGLIILGATNRADILDPALLRPGRFDRQVPVERPDVKGREEILRIHSKNVKLDDDVDFESVAHGTTGFAGADLANVVNEAALLAVRNGRKKVSMVDFNDAIDKVSIGLKKKTRSENEKERKIVAIHETGHALMGAFTPDYPPVNKITVVPRSHGVGGFTQYREEQEKSLKTKTDLINEVDVLLGGRAAEQVMFNEVSTGASNDISRATDIVKSMITDYGMSDKFPNMTLGKGVRGYSGGEPELIREFSEETQKYIDEEIARIVNERYKNAINVLKKHKELINVVANTLLEKETIDGKTFSELVEAEKHCASLIDGKE